MRSYLNLCVCNKALLHQKGYVMRPLAFFQYLQTFTNCGVTRDNKKTFRGLVGEIYSIYGIDSRCIVFPY